MIATKDIGAKLKAIAPKVNYTLKIEAVQEFGVHENTINRYLKGDAPKERFAVKLLQYLQARIPA